MAIKGIPSGAAAVPAATIPSASPASAAPAAAAPAAATGFSDDSGWDTGIISTPTLASTDSGGGGSKGGVQN